MGVSRIDLTIDTDTDVAYISLSDKEVASTREVTEEVIVDLDKFGMVTGIEVLHVDAELPFQRLIDEFHVHSAVVEVLRLLRPSVGQSVFLRQGADGLASPVRGRVLVG